MLDNPSRDVVVVGGGIIGLSVAYALACRGITSTVLDRRELGREASWAGAGMIPPLAERPAVHPSVELRSWSARLHSEWADRLREETGIDNGYRRTGGVDVAFAESEEHELRTSAGRWKVEGIAYERLLPNDFARVEPALSPRLRVAYYLPDRAQIRNPWHLQALTKAVLARGCRLSAWNGVEGFETRGGRIQAVRTNHGTIACDMVVVSAGAWSESLLRSAGIETPTPPVKGQIVLLRSDRPLIGRIIEHGKKYLVPRDDGRILIGATEENAGFDTRTTSRGVHDLLRAAMEVCPILERAEVETSWAGLRPGSIDGRPYIGLAPGYSNLYVATGHYRGGLQLSPATGEIVADMIAGAPPRIDLSPFRVDREPDLTASDSIRS
jgi:glycine oxidase